MDKIISYQSYDESQTFVDVNFPPLSKYVKTTDNWCPCYPNNTVYVKLRFLTIPCPATHQYYMKFQAWGMDDFGVEIERDVRADELKTVYETYKQMYDEIPEPVTIQYFYDHGFVDF